MNIISQLKNMLSTEQVADIAESVGETKDGVGKALGGIFPLLLGGLLTKNNESNSTNVMGKVADLFKQAPAAEDIANKSTGLTSMLMGKSGLAEKFLPAVFGDKTAGITTLISHLSGVKTSSASSLLAMAVPMMMGGVNKVLGGAPSASQLSSLLQSQKDNIVGQIPSGLGNVLGLGNLGIDKQDINQAVAKGKSWLPRIIGIIVLSLIILFFWKLCSKEHNATNQVAHEETTNTSLQLDNQPAANTHQGTVKAAWEHLGKFFAVKLPNGVELSIPEYGVENKLLTFIKDTNQPTDKVSWFSFDRLLFETGSTQLTADSSEQLQNIAEILKAYPKVTIKIGGYTDNTGTAEVNARVSQDRADTVRNQLIALGIGADRIEAKGYGQEHPVAPNDTEEDRAKNRRIDVLVTDK